MIKCPKCDKVLSGLDMELYDTYCDGHEYCRVNYCTCPECGHKFGARKYYLYDRTELSEEWD